MSETQSAPTVVEAPPQPQSEPVDVDAKLEQRAESFFSSLGEESESEPEPEPEWDPAEEFAAEDESDEAAEASGEGEGGEPEAEEESSYYGTKDQPFSIDDVPDEYATVKVDGEEQTVSIQEAVRNYTKQQAVDQRLARTKKLLETAEQRSEESVQSRQRFEQGIHRTFSDPGRALSFLDKHYPDVLDAVTMKHDARLAKAIEQSGRDPREALNAILAERRRQRQQRESEASRQATERKAREAEARLARQDMLQRVQPALKAAMASTGFNTPTKDVMSDIGTALTSAERRKGAPLTTQEIQATAEKVLRWNAPEKTEEGGKARKPRKPRRRRSPAPVQASRKGGGGGSTNGEAPMRAADGRLNEDYVMAKLQQRGRRA